MGKSVLIVQVWVEVEGRGGDGARSGEAHGADRGEVIFTSCAPENNNAAIHAVLKATPQCTGEFLRRRVSLGTLDDTNAREPFAPPQESKCYTAVKLLKNG